MTNAKQHLGFHNDKKDESADVHINCFINEFFAIKPKSVDNPADGCGIKERCGGTKDAQKHVVMQK